MWKRLLTSRPRSKVLLFIVLVGLPASAAVWGPLVRVEYALYQARRALAVRDAEAALPLLSTAERLDPNRAETQFLLARAQRRLGQMDDVRTHIEHAWRLGFPVEKLEREQWLAAAQSGQHRESEPFLVQLLTDPQGDGPEICEAYVSGYLATYRFREAMGLLDAWQADYPEDPQAWYIRGLYAVHRAKDQDAIIAFQKGLELAPRQHVMRLYLAQVHLKLHQHAEAAAQLRVVLQADPNNPDALSGRGQCLLEEGRIDEARQVLGQLLAAHPGHVAGVIAMARLELQAGRPAEALRHVRPIVEQKPHDYSARFVLASALQASGEVEPAREHFLYIEEAQRELNRARSLIDKTVFEPNDAEVRFEIGTILLKYGLESEGAGWLRSVLEYDPDHVGAHRALARYYAAIEVYELAAEHQQLGRAEPGATAAPWPSAHGERESAANTDMEPAAAETRPTAADTQIGPGLRGR